MVASLQIASITHEGLAREHNEDCLCYRTVGVQLFHHQATCGSRTAPCPAIRVVHGPDGVGGQAAGRSGQSICLPQTERRWGIHTDAELLLKAIIQVHTELYAMMKREPRYTAMGSTIAGKLRFAANRRPRLQCWRQPCVARAKRISGQDQRGRHCSRCTWGLI